MPVSKGIGSEYRIQETGDRIQETEYRRQNGATTKAGNQAAGDQDNRGFRLLMSGCENGQMRNHINTFAKSAKSVESAANCKKKTVNFESFLQNKANL